MFEFLKANSEQIVEYIDNLAANTIGKKTYFNDGTELQDLKKFQIAIIGVPDNRGNSEIERVDIDSIRREFYSLYLGNWNLKIIDLGDIIPGDTLESTYFLLSQITDSLLRENVIPIVLGGSQDLVYPIYRAYDKNRSYVNIVSIDSKLDLSKPDKTPAEQFLLRIIMDKPNKLFNFSNLAYQSYYNSQEEIDLLWSLNFEAYRLGELNKNIKLAEPILRDADLVCIDVNSIKSADVGNNLNFRPNGLSGKEICALSRYSGISDRVSCFGIFNFSNNSNEAKLIAQMIWYFVEGYNFRANEYPFDNIMDSLKYIVPIEGYGELIFYKSNISNRWWVELDNEDLNPCVEFPIYLPCSYEDYLSASNQDFPDRIWQFIKRLSM